MTIRLPPLSCLDNPRDQMTLFRATEQGRKEIMQSCLRELKLKAQITEVVCASGVLRYSLRLDKSNCLMSLSAFEDKIASFLGVEHIQLSLIQGRLFDIGIEISLESPNIHLRGILDSAPFQKTMRDTGHCHKNISNDDIITANNPGEDELIYALIPESVNIILEAQQASVSLLQRRLRIGYARAARVMDKLEELGIVGEFRCSKSRKILIKKEEWKKLRANLPI